MRKDEFEGLRQWWDIGKVKIMMLCQQYTFSVTRDITRSMKKLETEIVELQDLADATKDQGYLETLKSKKSFLIDLLGVWAQGALV